MSRGPFEYSGINHLAIVCSDMAETVDFYSGVLGMPLVKTIELPFGLGQHFFFDCGGGDCLAFFWFPEAPPRAPGVAAPVDRPDRGPLTSAVGSMNHVAFNVPAEKMDEYRDRLIAAGVDCTEVANHDNSEIGLAEEVTDDVYVRSIYFLGPDGVLLEFAAWTQSLEGADTSVVPARASDAVGAPVP